MIFQYGTPRSSPDTQHRPAPLRRIAWHAMQSEAEALDAVRSTLPVTQASRADVERFLRDEDLQAAAIGHNILYAYARGWRAPGSSVETDWLIEFHFDADQLDELIVEQRVTAP